MTKDTVIIRNENLIIDRVENEIIVFNEETQNTHILNEIAGFLLQTADNIKIDKIINQLYNNLADEDKKAYSIKDVTCDCMCALQEMIQQGLLIEK